MALVSILVAVVVVVGYKGIFPFSNRFSGQLGSLQRLLSSLYKKKIHKTVFANVYLYSLLNVVMI